VEKSSKLTKRHRDSGGSVDARSDAATRNTEDAFSQHIGGIWIETG